MCRQRPVAPGSHVVGRSTVMTNQRCPDSLPVWLIGRRYWKVGDHGHVWVVEAIEPGKAGQAPFAILVTSDGFNSEDVELSRLNNSDLYTPLQASSAETN